VGRIVLFREEEFHDYILGDATNTYKGKLDKFLRHVVHIRPGVFVIVDELEAPEPVTYEWWLHALSEMQLDAVTGSIIVSQGDARLDVQFFQPEELDMIQFRGFPDPPEINRNPMNITMGIVEKDQWHVTVSTRAKSSKARFIVLLIPSKVGRRPLITAPRLDGDTFLLGFNGKEYSIRLGPRLVVQRTER
jgi:hypothetical protein